MKSHTDLDETAPEIRLSMTEKRPRLYIWVDEYVGWESGAPSWNGFGGSDE